MLCGICSDGTCPLEWYQGGLFPEKFSFFFLSILCYFHTTKQDSPLSHCFTCIGCVWSNYFSLLLTSHLDCFPAYEWGDNMGAKYGIDNENVHICMAWKVATSTKRLLVFVTLMSTKVGIGTNMSLVVLFITLSFFRTPFFSKMACQVDIYVGDEKCYFSSRRILPLKTYFIHYHYKSWSSLALQSNLSE